MKHTFWTAIAKNYRKLLIAAGIPAALLFSGCGLSSAQFSKTGILVPKTSDASKQASEENEGGSLGAGSQKTGKLSYERLHDGDVMVTNYLGILNVRSGPSAEYPVIDIIGYNQSVRCYWKDEEKYAKIYYRKSSTEDESVGYCLTECLSETVPDEALIYLAVPDYKQYDPEWAFVPLGESSENIWSAGCTTCCLAMSYSYLEGKTTTPDGMVDRLYYNSRGMLGMPKVYDGYDGNDFLSVVYTQLCKQVPVLVGSRRMDGSPHWVLVVGYCGAEGGSDEKSDYLIHDPNSTERKTLADFFAEFPDFNRIAYYDLAAYEKRLAEEEESRRIEEESIRQSEEESIYQSMVDAGEIEPKEEGNEEISNADISNAEISNTETDTSGAPSEPEGEPSPENTEEEET